MKFFQHFANVVAQWWSKVLRNLPLRMAVGRFGIWLMKIGRFLQVRYANWNSEFRLQHEVNHLSPEYCEIHVSEPVINETTITFSGPSSQPHKSTPMVQALFGVKGVAQVTLQRYKIAVIKAQVYRWEEILPDVERILLEHLTA